MKKTVKYLFLISTLKNSISLIILFFILIINPVYSQENIHKFVLELNDLTDTNWKFKIDTTKITKEEINSLSQINAGNYIGIIEVYLKDTFQFSLLVFSSNNIVKLSEEVSNYHRLSNCSLTEDYDDGYNAIIKYDNLVVFLPMYPCWSNGYSNKSKILIKKFAQHYK